MCKAYYLFSGRCMVEIRANVTEKQKAYVERLVDEGVIKSESEFVRFKILHDMRYNGGEK